LRIAIDAAIQVNCQKTCTWKHSTFAIRYSLISADVTGIAPGQKREIPLVQKKYGVNSIDGRTEKIIGIFPLLAFSSLLAADR
jgi:hypothetical protein